jgi:DNA-binding NtrC family response regulator
METGFDQVRQCLSSLQEFKDSTLSYDMALLPGEAGTGNEPIPRAIDEYNCPAIPSLLFECEFFGHEQTSGRRPCNQSTIRRNHRVIVSARRVRQTRAMTSKSSSKLVAIIDDDRSVQNALKDLMESVGLSAWCFGSADEFLESDQRNHTACLVTDICMPGMSGLELQARLMTEGSGAPIIFITAHGDAKMRMQAMKAGAVGFLPKPFDDEILLEKVLAALKD